MRECLPRFPKRPCIMQLRLDNGNVLRVSSTQDSAVCAAAPGSWYRPFGRAVSDTYVAPVWRYLHPDFPAGWWNLLTSWIWNIRRRINVYEEVEPLISKIYRQNRQIRLQLEAARRQQKEFSIITENMQEGLLVIDRYTMVLSVNSSVGKLLKVNEVRTGESVYLLNRSEEFRGVVGAGS